MIVSSLALHNIYDRNEREQALREIARVMKHGGHVGIIDRLLAFYEKRQARLLELLAEGPQTPAQLAPRVFPHARPAQLYLTLSEVMGNLEVLEERGCVRREERSGRIVFLRELE